MDPLLRGLVAAGLLALIVVGIRLGRALFVARTQRLVARLNAATTGDVGEPRILYFTAERCAQCRHQQEPALRDLLATAPEPVRLETYDAAGDRVAATRYGILTAPSTVVLRPDGRVAAINHGFADAGQLATQLGWRAGGASKIDRVPAGRGQSADPAV